MTGPTLYASLPVAAARTKDALRGVVNFPTSVELTPEAESEVLLREALLKSVVSPALFRAPDKGAKGCTHAEGSRFVKSSYLYCDFDDGKTTMASFREHAQHLRFVLYTSTNHLREKDGVTCERFHVLFPLDEEVRDERRFGRLLVKLQTHFGSDPRSATVKRKFYPPLGAADPTFALNRGEVDVLSLLRTPKGERNATLFDLACRAAQEGLGQEEVLEALRLERLDAERPDDRDIDDATLRSMAERAYRFYGRGAERYQEYERRYVIVEDPRGVYDVATNHMKPDRDATSFYALDPGNRIKEQGAKVADLFRLWQQKTARRAHCIQFSPDREPRGIYDELRGESTLRVFNTFAGLVRPSTDGSCDLFLTHVEDVVCGGDRAASAWLLDYLAYIYQHPADRERKFTYAVALNGLQGTGKGSFVEYFGALFREGFVEINDAKLMDNFNATLANKIVVFLDEATKPNWEGMSRKLKSLITSRDIIINDKFVPQYKLDNHARFFFATNSSLSAPVEHKDRRYVCLEVSAARRCDAAYFTALHAEMDGGGLGALARFLAERRVDEARLWERPITAKYVENMRSHLVAESPLFALFDDLVETATEAEEALDYVPRLSTYSDFEQEPTETDRATTEGFVPTVRLIERVRALVRDDRNGRGQATFRAKELHEQMRTYFPRLRQSQTRMRLPPDFSPTMCRGYYVSGVRFLRGLIEEALDVRSEGVRSVKVVDERGAASGAVSLGRSRRDGESVEATTGEPRRRLSLVIATKNSGESRQA